MANHENDQALLDRARAGERYAFDELVSAYREPLLAHIERRTGAYLRARIDTEDALQEALTRAWRSIGSFRGRGEKTFQAWLRTTAEHVILDLATRHRPRRGGVIYLPETGEPVDPEPSPSHALRRRERLARLREALDGLSEEHREVIMLVRIEGLKIREAADRMNRTPNAVMKLLTRALEKLRGAFGNTDSLHLPAARLDGEGERGHDL